MGQTLGTELRPLSQHVLKLGDRTADQFATTVGFSVPERLGRWTIGVDAVLTFVLPKDVAGDIVLTLNYSTFVMPDVLDEQRVVVTVNGHEAASWRALDRNPRWRSVFVARNAIDASKVMTVGFHLPDSVSPADLKINDDHRRLGILIHQISWKSVWGKPAADHPIWQLGRPVGGEARKTFDQKVLSGFWARFITGPNVLDIGYRGYTNVKGVVPISETALGIELDYPGYDGKTLPFENDSQDAVYSSHCLEHIADYVGTIREWHRVTKIGGHIITAVPHAYLYERAEHPPSRWNRTHYRFYTPASLLAEFQEALVPNSYRVRYLADNDQNYRYELPFDVHPDGCYEIVLVIQKIKRPSWDVAPVDERVG